MSAAGMGSFMDGPNSCHSWCGNNDSPSGAANEELQRQVVGCQSRVM